MSPIPAGPYLPNGGLVLTSWLAGIDGLSSDIVATSLPRELASWADAGFVQATVIPSPAAVDSGQARTLFAQIDTWAVRLEASGDVSPKRPVARAWRLAELILRGMEDDAQGSRFGKPVTMPANYLPARVLSAWPTTEPAEIPDDPSSYARITFDIALSWARI